MTLSSNRHPAIHSSGPAVLILIRSVVFNLLFYLNLLIYMTAAMPTLVLPYRVLVAFAKSWGRTNLWLLRVICNINVDWKGLEKIPTGALIVAAKHQSTWDTFALLTLFRDPTFIIKRELMWIPVFGWYAWKAGLIAVDRGAGLAALARMSARALQALKASRQVIIFPEGTRRVPGAEPSYRPGITQLYGKAGVPCVPVALNSGLFWPRRSFLRFPGTVLVEVLDPIAPGLDRKAFSARLQDAIETACTRLLTEAKEQQTGVTSQRASGSSPA